MAYASKNLPLVEDLVTSITKQPKDNSSFRQLRDNTARGLRDQSAARTDQFDVWSKLNGLVEKFGILNREDLSDALQARLDKLPSQGSRWQPEILSLLLLLSDKPVEKTKLGDLRRTEPQKEPHSEQLTFDEIIADDPLNEPGLWDDVERGYHSSGDEGHLRSGSETSVSTRATSTAEEDVRIVARSFVKATPQDVATTDPDWRTKAQEAWGRNTVSEVYAIRESLLMLRGLPTSLYHFSHSAGFTINGHRCLSTATQRTTMDALEQCASLANSLLPLRSWLDSSRVVPYLQAIQSTTATMLSNLDLSITKYERRYITPNDVVTASIIELLDYTRATSRALVMVSDAIRSCLEQGSNLPFTLIDCFYENACTAQSTGDDEIFDAFGRLAWVGLKTYLQDVESWVDRGELPIMSREFFARQAHDGCEASNLYNGRFVIVELPNGSPSAPQIFAPFIGKAFAMGKSRAFLSALGWQFEELLPGTQTRTLLSFDSVAQELKEFPLLPLSQLIGQALDGWFGSAEQDSTIVLRCQLLDNKGLFHSLDIFEFVCCSRDGVLFQIFADNLFDRIDRSPSGWQDPYMLTELAQETLGSHGSVDAAGIRVRIPSTSNDQQVDRVNGSPLQCVRMEVEIPWHIQNITREATPESHSKAFILLLQLYGAKRVLRRDILDFRSGKSYRAGIILRQRLTWLVNTLSFHCASVIHTLGLEVREQLRTAADIDAIAAVYSTYKRRLELNLLIDFAYMPIRGAMISLLNLCVDFRSTQEDVTTSKANAKEPSNTSLGRLTRKDTAPEIFTSLPLSTEPFREMRSQYTKLSSFLVAGIRSVSRASGERMLEELAEKLEWAPT